MEVKLLENRRGTSRPKSMNPAISQLKLSNIWGQIGRCFVNNFQSRPYIQILFLRMASRSVFKNEINRFYPIPHSRDQ